MQNLYLKKAFYTLLMLVVIGRARAITYYISSNGNDNSAGTSMNTAWQTISKLNSMNLLPGTVVLFEGGASFAGSLLLDAADANDPSNPVYFSSYGTGRATILSGPAVGFSAYNTKGFKVSDLIFKGSGMSTNTNNGVSLYTDLTGNVKLQNITLSNIEIFNYGKLGLSVYSSYSNTGFKNVLIDGVHIHHVKENGLFIGGYTSPTHVGWAHRQITIKNTEVNDIPGYADPSVHRGSGIIMAQVDSGIIERCAAHHTGSSNTHCGGPGGIWAYDCNNVTIQHCESYRNSSGSGCDGLGFDLDGGMTNSVLQYNYSHDNDGAGYLLGQYDNARPWSNNVVRYNISENDGRTNAGGITLFKGANTSMNGCRIYHNTIYTDASATNAGVGAFTVINWNTGITGIEVYNNIFQTSGGASLVDVPTGYDVSFAGNLYWASNGAFKIRYQGIDHSSVTAWRAASGNEQVGNLQTGITADPFLTNIGAGTVVWPAPSYSLNAYATATSSPAINTALNLANLFGIDPGTKDFFTSAIPGPADIGAYENPASMTTSLSGNDASGTLSFFPNPVHAGEDIFLVGGEAPYAMEFLSLNGAMISREIVPGSVYHIPEGSIPVGLYIIRIIDNRKRLTSAKIIIL